MADDQSQTTRKPYVPVAPPGMPIYFYVGWDAHKEGLPLDPATDLEWRAGWIARQDMIVHAKMTGVLTDG